MKLLSKLILALATASACAVAGAQTDADRRARNREEAIAQHKQSGPMAEVREKTHQGARATRRFTHRELQKARRFKAREDRRYPAHRGTARPANAALIGR